MSKSVVGKAQILIVLLMVVAFHFSHAQSIDTKLERAHITPYNTLIVKANEEFGKGNLKDAKQGFQEAIAMDSTNYLGYMGLSQVAAKQGDTIATLNALTKAKRYGENVLQVWTASGFYNLMIGDIEAAKEDLKSAEEINANYPKVFEMKASILLHEEKWQEAIEPMQKLLAVEPNSLLALANLGYCEQKVGDYAKSIYYCNHFLELNPKVSAVLNSKGFSLYKTGDAKGGEKLIAKAIQLDAKNGEAFINMGVILAERGKISRACKFFEEAEKRELTNTSFEELKTYRAKYCQ